MRRPSGRLAFIALALVRSPAAAAEASPPAFAWSNPLPFSYAEGQTAPRREVRDPCIIREGDRYYLVFTMWPFRGREESHLTEPNQGGSPGIALYASPDLKAWKFETWLVRSSELPESCPYKNRFWAPEIHKLGGRFYLIFTADNWLKKEYNPAGTWGAAGYAFVGTAERIAGPYEHITYIEGAACDTSLFEDADGRTYAIIPRHHIDLQEIDLTGLSRGAVKLLGRPERIVAAENADIGIEAKPEYLEGPWIEKLDGRYCLLYAEIYRDRKYPDWLGYWTGAAYAEDVRGPWKKDPRGKLFLGGHLAAFRGPDGGRWFSYRSESRNPARGLLCIDPFGMGPDGRIQSSAPTAGGPAAVPGSTGPFLIGADVSWVPQQEAEGRRFSAGGEERDILAILKEHGFNSIRLRLFVDPAAPGGYSAKSYCGLESTLGMARRVKSAGLKLLLDFHYSDTWADPAHQTKPAAWRELDFAGLTSTVERYTREALAEFARRGLSPDIVQVGNEINHGLLWPDGKTDDFDKLAALLRAGIRGAREAAPSARVMLHLALGGQNEESRWFLDSVLRRGIEFDLIGQSYYPRWHGTLDDLKRNLTDLASRYPQAIVVVEYSSPYVREVNDIVRSLPGGKGRGTFIWEPTHPGHGNLFDANGSALPALQEFRRFAQAIPAGTAAATFARAGGGEPDRLIPAEKNLPAAWLQALTARGERRPYSGEELLTIGMPCGGIAAGQLYVRGDGTLAQWWIANNASGTAYWWEPLKPEERREACFATPLGTYCAAYRTYRPPSPIDQGFALRVQAEGQAARVCPLSRDGFDDPRFFGEYPIARIEYGSPRGGELPVRIAAEIFSPFIPLDARESAFPATILRYEVKNISPHRVDVRLLGWLENPVCLGLKERAAGSSRNAAIRHGRMTSIEMDLAPLEMAPEAPSSLRTFEDFEGDSYGSWTAEGTAFGTAPARGTLAGQQPIIGFKGQGLANSFLGGDEPQGRLVSPEFVIREKHITFLIGSGPYPGQTCLSLVVDGQAVRTATGRRNTVLAPGWWDVGDLAGRRAHLVILDAASGPWGHITVDEIRFADRPPLEAFPREDPQFGNLALSALDPEASASADCGPVDVLLSALAAGTPLRGPDLARRPLGTPLLGALETSLRLEPGESRTADFLLTWYFPNRGSDPGGANNWGRPIGGGPRVGQMYASWFNSVLDVARSIAADFERLDRETRLFRDTFFDTTLPYWFVQRIGMPAANLATETTQWWGNGRFYGWEGVGCCEGTCTHVWHYEQALGRLFPELARSIREMQNLNPETGFDPRTGGINDRGRVPGIVATDGQCGVILASYREHLMSAGDGFLRRTWPRLRQAILYLIAQDGDGDGLIENEQPNTYDISFFGANTFCGSLYLASLRAGEEMARLMGDGELAGRCRTIFVSGRERTMERLWNGEHFIQEVDLEKHPRFQYGTGCLADQVIGQGWAHQVGLGPIYPPEAVRSALKAVWKYNWASDVGPYNAVHRPEIIFADPGEAGLFLCTWPEDRHLREKGVRYHDTVWTGIEGQVSAHMIAEGLIAEGLAVLRAVHDRYDGRKHNPWNQILCGDHYARAMSSWGCLIAASGYEYDGPAGRLGFAPRIGPEDFKAFFSAAEGWGSLIQTRREGLQTDVLDLKWGRLRLSTLELELPEGASLKRGSLERGGRPIESKFKQEGRRVRCAIAGEVLLKAGEALRASLEH